MAWKDISHGKGVPPLFAQFKTEEVVAFSSYANHEIMIVFQSGATLTLVGKDGADAQRLLSHLKAAL